MLALQVLDHVLKLMQMSFLPISKGTLSGSVLFLAQGWACGSWLASRFLADLFCWLVSLCNRPAIGTRMDTEMSVGVVGVGLDTRAGTDTGIEKSASVWMGIHRESIRVDAIVDLTRSTIVASAMDLVVRSMMTEAIVVVDMVVAVAVTIVPRVVDADVTMNVDMVRSSMTKAGITAVGHVNVVVVVFRVRVVIVVGVIVVVVVVVIEGVGVHGCGGWMSTEKNDCIRLDEEE